MENEMPINYTSSDFRWETQMGWDSFYDPYHQERYPGHVIANIVAWIKDNRHLNFQPDENNVLDLGYESGDDYEEILGHPPYESPSYEELREYAQGLYDSELRRFLG